MGGAPAAAVPGAIWCCCGRIVVPRSPIVVCGGVPICSGIDEDDAATDLPPPWCSPDVLVVDTAGAVVLVVFAAVVAPCITRPIIVSPDCCCCC